MHATSSSEAANHGLFEERWNRCRRNRIPFPRAEWSATSTDERTRSGEERADGDGSPARRTRTFQKRGIGVEFTDGSNLRNPGGCPPNRGAGRTGRSITPGSSRRGERLFHDAGKGENSQRTENPRSRFPNTRARLSAADGVSRGSRNGSGQSRTRRPHQARSSGVAGPGARRTQVARPYDGERTWATQRALDGLEVSNTGEEPGPEVRSRRNATPSACPTRREATNRSRNSANSSPRWSRSGCGVQCHVARDSSFAVSRRGESTFVENERGSRRRRCVRNVNDGASRHSQVAGTPPRGGARPGPHVVP